MDLSFNIIILKHIVAVWKYFQNCYILESRKMPAGYELWDQLKKIIGKLHIISLRNN